VEEPPVFGYLEIDPAHPVNNEEIAELSRRNSALRFERTSQGALLVSPTGSSSGLRSGELARQLTAWNQQTKRGRFFDSSTGFELPNSAIYAPDGAWMAEERWQTLTSEEREEFAPLCPDVVFEIRSKTDALGKLLRKLHDYIDAGATLAVLLDPYKRTVAYIFAGEEPKTLADPATVSFISASDVDPLPGFTLDFQAILQSAE
jgi:Uma2 family endonuclease